MNIIIHSVFSSVSPHLRHLQGRATSAMDSERQLPRTRQDFYPRMGRMYYHERNSDPDLLSYGRSLEQRGDENDIQMRRGDSQEVAFVVRDEMQNQLSAFREDLKAIIQPALEARQSKPQSAVSSLM
jgi:hypothetical protein